jgi:hypothetical protein
MAAGVIAGTALIAGSTTANAAAPAPAAKSHTVAYTCKIPVLGTKSVKTKLTLSAPAKSTAGKTVKISLKLQPSGLPAVTITNVTIKSALTLSGAQKGTVKLSAHFASGNSGNIKVNLTGKLKLAKAGTVDLKAGSSATFSLTNSILGKTTLVCTTKAKLPVLGKITVVKPAKASPGTASPGTASALADER